MSTPIGDFIKRLRDEKGFTQEELARISGVDDRTIQRIESGETKRPQRYNLERLAAALGVEAGVLQQACREGYATDATKTPASISGSNEAATLLPESFAPPPTTNHNKRHLAQIVVAGMIILPLLILASYVFISNSWAEHINKPVVIVGNVVCADNEPVIGVWIDTFIGSTVNKSISGYADMHNLNKSGSAVEFVYMFKGDAYNVHVGCGGTILHWKGKYYTELGSGPVRDLNVHSFWCHDVPPAVDFGTCKLTK